MAYAVMTGIIMEGCVLRLATNRKSVRSYSREGVPLSSVLYAIKAALQAPSGANQQPWVFVVIEDMELKKKIREVCERGERKFHERVRGELKEWFRSRGISWKKPFLEEAPYLIAVFSLIGKPFAIQSTWLSVGYLLLALEEKGLASLTYTPSNPSEIGKILGAPKEAVLQTIIPVGKEIRSKVKEPREGLEEKIFINGWGSRISPDLHQ